MNFNFRKNTLKYLVMLSPHFAITIIHAMSLICQEIKVWLSFEDKRYFKVSFQLTFGVEL